MFLTTAAMFAAIIFAAATGVASTIAADPHRRVLGPPSLARFCIGGSYLAAMLLIIALIHYLWTSW